jgi:hypothetical protein
MGAQMFHEKVERLSDQIRDEDLMRLLEPTSLPKILRGHEPRRRPQTAIISRAANAATTLKNFLSARERMLARIARKLRFREPQ